MKTKVLAALAAGCFILVTGATSFALPFAEDYSNSVAAHQNNPVGWIFPNQLTNAEQQTELNAFLDGFYAPVPEGSVMKTVFNPTDSWEKGFGGELLPEHGMPFDTMEVVFKRGYTWFRWWAMEPGSLYPIGSTTIFRYLAGGMVLGNNVGAVVTSWTLTNPRVGISYSENTKDRSFCYSANLFAPAAQPASGSTDMLLLGAGLIGLAGGSRPRKQKYAC